MFNQMLQKNRPRPYAVMQLQTALRWHAVYQDSLMKTMSIPHLTYTVIKLNANYDIVTTFERRRRNGAEKASMLKGESTSKYER